MKKILLFCCTIALLATTGCFIVPGRGPGWRRADNDGATNNVATNNVATPAVAASAAPSAPSATPSAPAVATP
jgi:hypothetical protein